MKVGDKVKLKNCSHFADYKIHYNDVGTIIERKLPQIDFYPSFYDFNIKIKWKNGDTSLANTSNLIKINTEPYNRKAAMKCSTSIKGPIKRLKERGILLEYLNQIEGDEK